MSRLSDAVLRLGAAARRAAREGLLLAAALLPLAAGAARAGPKAALSIDLNVQGLSQVRDLSASPGALSGSINLSWTEPSRHGASAPFSYDIRVSSLAQISDNNDFAAASPLSAFSAAAIPSPGAGGGGASLAVTGLSPGVTYYFALREEDSGAPQLVGVWRRDVVKGWNTGNFAAPAFVPSAPGAVADLAAAATASEGELKVSWTSVSNPNLTPMATYVLKYATFSIAGLAGDTTAWYDAAPSSATLVAPAAGQPVSITLEGLNPLTTFYFAVKGVDTLGEVSPIDDHAAAGSQASSRPGDVAPGTPSGLGAVAGLKSATVSWTALTATQKGLDFAFYRLYRSTDDAAYVQVATTTAVSYLDAPLIAGASYYYRVAASEGPGGLDSALSASTFTVALGLPPQHPFGLRAAPGPASITLTWSPTERLGDGTLFADPSSPARDELTGYRIWRSTDLCSGFVALSTMTAASTSYTDATGGDAYYYDVRAFNDLAESTGTLAVSTLGELHIPTDDCGSELVLDPQQSYSLLKSSDGLGADILIDHARRPQDVADDVVQSVQFRALLDGKTELKGFYLPKPAVIKLHYLSQGGSPVGDTRPLGTASAASAPASAGVANVGAYWFDGLEYRKVYGTVDATGQTVTVQSPNLGVYQVRRMLRSDGVVFDVSNVSGRVITPNGDGLNDVLIFTYDPGPANVTPTGAVYDLHGALVSTMKPGAVPNTLTWDGSANGRAVASGVYVYQIRGDGKTFNGTIVVAR